MAQLTDDCFAFGGSLLRVDAAQALLRERLSCRVGVETVPLAQADGRILAETLLAGVDVPPHANAAVDGYAVRYHDLATAVETALPVLARVAAGQSPPLVTGIGAVRIFTGAMMPAGFDTVMMQEDVRTAPEAGLVLLRPGLPRGANVRQPGEDLASGSIVVPAGRRLRPQEIGLAASVGISRLSVRLPLRVALLSTGDELVEPGQPLPPGAIHDSNRHTLAALLRRMGCRVVDRGICPDRPDAIRRTLAEAASDADLVVTSGGVSAGEEDHVKAALDTLGRLHFWRLAIKPGRPAAMGVIDSGGGGVPFVGLPGNPVAAMVTFLHLVRPMVERLSGWDAPRPRALPVRAGFACSKKPGRREYLRVSLHATDEGAVEARRFPREGAGILSSMAAADGLVELGEEVVRVEVGTPVPYFPMELLLP